jgi:selenocysteine-specific elongation factor
MRVIATAGHVDHGKSSLVLALTGTDPDRFEEEKRRGLTIDLGFAHTVLPDGAAISIVDVPGHVRFLRNMLAGVGAVDACLFVVAATEGWKPQSEEHLRILELLGIGRGVVALTKVDLVDDEWRQLAELEVADHLVGTFLEGAAIVPVAATAGLGLDDLRTALSVMVADTEGALDRGWMRLWVDRVFAAKGSGTVVTGTLTGGTIGVDDAVVVGPLARPARVRSIQTLGRSVERIGPGNRVALNLSGIDHVDIVRGDAVVHPGRWHTTRQVDASLQVLSDLDHDVSRRGAWMAYIGSGELPVRMRVLGTEALAPGATGAVRLHLPHDLPLLPGDRFVLRESGRSETVGGGEVLDVSPVLPASRARPDRSWQRVVAERGWVEVDELERLTGERHTPTVGRWVTHPDAVAALAAGLVEAVAGAGPLGLDIAALDDRQRAVLAEVPTLRVDAGRVLPVEVRDPLADHPVVQQLRAAGCSPPEVTLPRDELRELVRRRVLLQLDGIVFHPDALDVAAAAAARLLQAHPDGFTVAQLRDELGITRKHAVPIAAELDARAITRRREDLRIAGPRLPDV